MKLPLIEIPLVVITGQFCAGKTETLNILRNMGVIGLDMGQFFREYFRYTSGFRKGSVKDIKDLIVDTGRSKVMNDLYNHLLSIQTKDIRGLVLCGMRHEEDMEFFKERASQILTLFIYADGTTRFARCKKRGREGDPSNFESFLRVDMEELHHGLAQMLLRYPFKIIINHGTLSDLKRATIEIVEERIL